MISKSLEGRDSSRPGRLGWGAPGGVLGVGGRALGGRGRAGAAPAVGAVAGGEDPCRSRSSPGSLGSPASLGSAGSLCSPGSPAPPDFPWRLPGGSLPLPPGVAACESGPGCSEFCGNLRVWFWLLPTCGFENQKLKKPNVFSMLRTSKIRNWRKSANLVPAAPDFAEICEQGPGCS